MARPRWPVLALILAVLPLGAAADTPAGKSLNNYRLQASLPAVCSQIGGKAIYNGHSPQCQMPTVTTGKAPVQSQSSGQHALPVTIRH